MPKPTSSYLEYRTEIDQFDRTSRAKALRAMSLSTLEDCISWHREIAALMLEGIIPKEVADVMLAAVAEARKSILARTAGDQQNSILDQISKLSNVTGSRTLTLGIGASMTMEIPQSDDRPVELLTIDGRPVEESE